MIIQEIISKFPPEVSQPICFENLTA